MKIEAVVFDMDGVLIDAKDWHYHALNRALEHFGYTISRADHLSTFDGLPTRKKLEMLSQERGLPRGLHEFLNQLKQKYTTDQVHTSCHPIFVHEYALSNLKARGYKLGLASNSVRNSVELMMEKSALEPYLDVMLSNEDVKKPKPDPDMYLTATRMLGVDPANTLVVEDNENGIKAARDAGCHLLVVQSVYDVQLDRILDAIARVEGQA
ncbi:HAD family hydrolase [Sedimentitalea todarodis]|uniref:HAD family phosphatase n=1 Tax=Sedimentitalea todarodis TaxID=1631240 RepID=A0ABU3VH75_9RHOB|nr:HAD family phosphatase [Sedimentitalea todarodis]MDU9005539.1 HAD family phosphatase [Sedimentitalea todarodis]